MKKQENIGINGWFVIDHFDKAGKLIEQVITPNLVTSAGKAEVAGLITLDVAGMTAFDYIAIGTGATAAATGDTQLGTEVTENGGGRRGGADVVGTRVTTTVANDTGQFVTTFTFTTSGTYAVTESGVLNAASTGTLLCRQTFAAINVVEGDSLQVTWKVKAS